MFQLRPHATLPIIFGPAKSEQNNIQVQLQQHVVPRRTMLVALHSSTAAAEQQYLYVVPPYQRSVDIIAAVRQPRAQRACWAPFAVLLKHTTKPRSSSHCCCCWFVCLVRHSCQSTNTRLSRGREVVASPGCGRCQSSADQLSEGRSSIAFKTQVGSTTKTRERRTKII